MCPQSPYLLVLAESWKNWFLSRFTLSLFWMFLSSRLVVFLLPGRWDPTASVYPHSLNEVQSSFLLTGPSPGSGYLSADEDTNLHAIFHVRPGVGFVQYQKVFFVKFLTFLLPVSAQTWPLLLLWCTVHSVSGWSTQQIVSPEENCIYRQ